MTEPKVPLTMKALAEELKTLRSVCEDQQQQLRDFEVWQDLQIQRNAALEEKIERVLRHGNLTHDQLQGLVAQMGPCEGDHNMLLNIRNTVQNLVRQIDVIKSRLDLLGGVVKGGQEQTSKEFGRIEEEMDMLQERVFPEPWRDKLARWYYQWRYRGETDETI